MKFIGEILLFLISLCVIIHANMYKNNKESDVVERKKRGAIMKNFKFELPVKFYIGPFLNHTSILLALERITNYTCITFEQRYWYILGNSGFNFKRSFSCESPSGPLDTSDDHENYVLLSKYCEHDPGIIEILTGKMLGLIFEHARPDRNRYVTVNEENIDPRYKKYFNKYNHSTVDVYGLQYDLYSGLQIFPRNFSLYNRRVLDRVENFSIPDLQFGQLHGLSFNDHKVLFKRYCQYVSSINIKYKVYCENDGYPDPKTGKKCICPSGFRGKLCEKPIHDYDACSYNGRNIVNATSSPKTIHANGEGHCSYFIYARRKRLVKIHINESNTPYSFPCYPNKGNEIKYNYDKGTTGLTLCGNYSNITIHSEDQFLVVIYNGFDSDSKLTLTYSEYDYRSTTKTSPTTATTLRITKKKKGKKSKKSKKSKKTKN